MQVSDEGSGINRNAWLTASFDAPIKLDGLVDAPDESTVLAIGEADGLTAKLLSLQTEPDGTLKAVFRFTNNSDDTWKFNTYDATLSFFSTNCAMINGIECAGLSWDFENYRERTVPAHSSKICTIVIGGEPFSVFYDAGSYKRILSEAVTLQDFGICEVQSLCIQGIRLELTEPYALPASTKNKAVVYQHGDQGLAMTEVRVEPVDGCDNLWTIGFLMYGTKDTDTYHRV